MNEKVRRILTEIKKYLIESFGDKIRQSSFMVLMHGEITIKIPILIY